MMIGDAMTPLAPFDHLTSNLMLRSSMFPYSMLFASTNQKVLMLIVYTPRGSTRVRNIFLSN